MDTMIDYDSHDTNLRLPHRRVLPLPVNFYMPVTVQRYYQNNSLVVYGLFLAAAFYVVEFTCAMLFVLLSAVQGYFWIIRRMHEEAVFNLNSQIPNAFYQIFPMPTPTDSSSVAWFCTDIEFIFIVAVTNSVLTYAFAVGLPGVTGNPVEAVEQFGCELVSEWTHKSTTNRYASSKWIACLLYFCKCILIIFAQVCGAMTAKALVMWCVDDTIMARYIKTVTDRSGHEHKYTLVLGLIVYFLYILVKNMFHRISSRGHAPPLIRISGYPGACKVLAATKFFCVFVLFGITGSQMNFLLYMPFGEYDGGYYELCANLIGMSVAFVTACLVFNVDYWLETANTHAFETASLFEQGTTNVSAAELNAAIAQLTAAAHESQISAKKALTAVQTIQNQSSKTYTTTLDRQ